MNAMSLAEEQITIEMLAFAVAVLVTVAIGRKAQVKR